MGSSPVAVTWTSDIAPVLRKEFLDTQANIECGFTLKRVRSMIRRSSFYWCLFALLLLHHYSKRLSENPPIIIYTNKTQNRIVFKIKTGYKLELLSPETMKLLGSTKKDVDKDKDGEDVPKLESVEVVLMHCNLSASIQSIIYFCT